MSLKSSYRYRSSRAEKIAWLLERPWTQTAPLESIFRAMKHQGLIAPETRFACTNLPRLLEAAERYRDDYRQR